MVKKYSTNGTLLYYLPKMIRQKKSSSMYSSRGNAHDRLKYRLVYYGSKNRHKFRSADHNTCVVTARFVFRLLGSWAALSFIRMSRRRIKHVKIIINKKDAIWKKLLPHQKDVVMEVEKAKYSSINNNNSINDNDDGTLGHPTAVAPDVYVLHMNFGTGKTVTALYLSVFLFRAHEVFYLAPAQLLPHIKNEIDKFDLSCVAHVRVCSSLSEKEYGDKMQRVLIVDEYHLWTKRRKQLPSRNRNGWQTVLLLSGSPSPRGEHAAFIRSFSSDGQDGGVYHLDFMHVAGKILKQPLIDLRELDMNTEQKRIYAGMIERAGTYHQLQKDRAVLSAWKIPLLVKELCSNEVFVKKSCVIFSDFSSVLMNLWQTIIHLGRGQNPYKINLFRVFWGNPSQRQKQVEQFRKCCCEPVASTNVALCSTGVASHGLNLGEADVLVFLETPYTRRLMLQTFGRLTRIGQKNNQKAIFLTFKDSIEAHLLRANCHQFANMASS